MGSPQALVTLVIIVLWYVSNVGVLLLNKFLLTNTGFRQPVFLTLCHMLACCSLAYALSLTKSFPIRGLRSRRQLWKVCLLATIFCITIVLGNMSLKYIPVSFSQAVGAATPFFTAVLALTLQGSRESGVTYATLIPVVAGVAIASGGEPNFHLIGFLACLLATAGRALKSVVQAMLMTDPNEKLDPMSLLFYMSSFSVLLLLPATAVLEPSAFSRAGALMAVKGGFFWWLLLNSCMAYAVNLTNFMVTKHTSALTLQVLGNMKGVIAAAVSVAIFKNSVTFKGMVGYAITVGGVFLYSASKRRQQALKATDSAKSLAEEAAAEPLIKAGHLAALGGGGGGVQITLIADACGGGAMSGVSGGHHFGGGALLPTSTQALPGHRSGRSSAVGLGGGGGVLPVTIAGHA